MWPEADIYTHVYDPASASAEIRAHKVTCTFIHRLPNAKRFYKTYLPLMPMALENLDLSDYDVVISSESGPAKGVVVRPDAIHICYCHSPMRYIWDQYFKYRRGFGPVKRLLMSGMVTWLRQWDYTSASRVDQFVANSKFVAKRIKKYYRRDSVVIHPPVAVEDFEVQREKGEYFLCFGQLVAYKRVDLAIEAFNRLGLPLVVAGGGEELKALKAKALPNITFRGWVNDDEVPALIGKCRALIFPGEEDFGIVPIETMASGRPVIAYASGGAVETVLDGITGMLFEDQTADALTATVKRFVEHEESFNADIIRQRAEGFSCTVFRDRMTALLEQLIAEQKGTTTARPPVERKVPDPAIPVRAGVAR